MHLSCLRAGHVCHVSLKSLGRHSSSEWSSHPRWRRGLGLLILQARLGWTEQPAYRIAEGLSMAPKPDQLAATS